MYLLEYKITQKLARNTEESQKMQYRIQEKIFPSIWYMKWQESKSVKNIGKMKYYKFKIGKPPASDS